MKTFSQLVFDSTLKFPNNVGLRDKNGSYTYSEINKKSNIIANYFISLGITNSRIAINLPRGKDIVIAILGIMKAGCSYVPLDPEYPNERIKDIYLDSDFAKVITLKGLMKADFSKEGIGFSEDILLDFNDVLSSNGDDTDVDKSDINGECVIFYTSGSTGKPKGVIHSNRFYDSEGVCEFLDIKEGYLKFASAARFTFAASNFIVFSFATGGSYYVLSADEVVNLERIKEVIDTYDINAMFMPPKLTSSFLSTYKDVKLDFICMGGEKIQNIPNTNIKLVNIYGATEAGTMLVNYVCLGDKEGTMGKCPFENSETFLVDDDNNIITEKNVIGEFCIVSPTVSLGYCNLPELTSQKFVEVPDGSGRIMFKTADLMAYDDNGTLIFHGRKDYMVKLNGYRIELGEVETVMAKYEAVKEVVCAVKNVNGGDSLVCYYVKKANYEINDALFRQYATEHLPHYMVPSIWVALDSLPTNANGKLDRLSLPEPKITIGHEIIKPTSPEEAIYLKIARKILPEVKFGVTDDLESLGLNSMLCIKFVNELNELGIKVSVGDVMHHRNIRALVNNSRRLFWFHKPYDPAKPVLVCTQGIIYTNPLIEKYEDWSELFNVFVFDNIANHYELLFEDGNIESVSLFYSDLIEMNVPADAKIAGFIGFSWGGDLASKLVNEYVKRNPNVPKPFLILGDSYTSLLEKAKIFSDDELDKYCEKHGLDPNVRETIMRRNTVVLLNYDRDISVEHYKGHVVYFNAIIGVTDEYMEHKMGIIKSLFEDLEIIDCEDMDHNDLFIKKEMRPRFMEVFKRLLEM